MKEKPLIEARDIYRRNFVSIVLAVIGIIQGFAFNFLAPKFPEILFQGWQNGEFRVIAHFILCSILVMRVFQTYVIGALDYNKWNLAFSDMLFVFGTGLLQYFIFSFLAAVPSQFNIIAFYWLFLVLAVFAFLGYGRTMRLIKKNRFNSEYIPEQVSKYVPEQYFESEIRLQLANLTGISVLLAISLYVLIPNYFPPAPSLILERYPNDISYTILALIAAAILLLNIWYSWSATFQKPTITITRLTTEPKATFKPRKKKTKIETRNAIKSDIPAMADLIAYNFSYVYEALFGENRPIKKMIQALLTAGAGKHEWGFQRFHVAIEQVDKKEKVVGLLRMKTKESGIHPKYVISGVIMALVLIRYTGLLGLYHAIRRSEAVLSATHPVFLSDELHILYLAVDAKHLQNSVATKLVEIAYDKAQKEEKGYLVAEVRELNKLGLIFFLNQGFKKDALIESDCDYLLGKGKRIRMLKEVRTDASSKPKII